MNEKTQENIKTEDSKLLYEKLAEGISSMKAGEVYTIEEAWQEIDQLCILRGFPLKDYIEERAIGIANYIIDHNATVRQTAKAFGISKSTVHTVVTKQNA